MTERSTPRDESIPLEEPSPAGPMPPSVRRYAALWVVVAAGTVAANVALTSSGTWSLPAGSLGPLAVITLLTLLADRTRVLVRLGRSSQSLSPYEVGFAAALLLLPPPGVVAATVGGLAIGELLEDRERLKSVFNVSMHTVTHTAAAAAAWAVGLVPGRLRWMDLLAVLVALLVNAAVNQLVLGGLMRRLEGRRRNTTFVEGTGLAVAVTLGAAGSGAVFALVWTLRPWFAVLTLVPFAALYSLHRRALEGRSYLARMVANHDRLQRLVAGASDGIVLLDAAGQVEVWSPRMSELTGVPVERAVGSPIGEVLVGREPSGTPIDVAEPLRTATPDDAARSVEMVVAGGDARQRTIVARHSVRFDAHGRCVGDVILCHDVTRERELAAMEEDFVARASHELRTPLTSIMGFSQVLQTRWEELPDERKRTFVDTIERQSQRLWQLIATLLSANQVRAGRVRAEPAPVVVGDAVAEALTDVPEHPDVAIDGDVDAVVHADPQHLRQVLVNLIVNAHRYGGPPVTVRVERTDTGVEVRVSDEGPGVPPDFVPHLFEKFTQASRGDTRSATGLGLGLHVVRELLAVNGGAVWYEPNRPRGACFVVRLPEAPPEAAAAPRLVAS